MGINPHEFSVAPVQVSDFGNKTEEAHIFIAFTGLGTELGRMLDLASRLTKPSSAQVC